MNCKRCRKSFYRPSESRKQYCGPCKAKTRAAQVKEAHDREIAQSGGIPGIGQGNNQWGEKNPLWNGGSRTYRDMALGEQGNLCRLCDSFMSVRAHHINGNRSDNNIENLIMLCAACHGGIHAFEQEYGDCRRVNSNRKGRH